MYALPLVLSASWVYWPNVTNHTIGCGAGTAATAYVERGALGKSLGQYGVFEPAQFPVDVSDGTIEVLRHGSAETEYAEFVHAPGSGLFVDVSQMKVVQRQVAQKSRTDLLQWLESADAVVQYDAARQMTEVIFRLANASAGQTACPELPYLCECVSRAGVSLCADGTYARLAHAASHYCDDADHDFVFVWFFLVVFCLLAVAAVVVLW